MAITTVTDLDLEALALLDNTIYKEVIGSDTDVDLNFTYTAPNLDDARFTIPQALIDALGITRAIPTNADITECDINGNGTFDVLARSVSNMLKTEWSEGRITGPQYSSAYIGLMEAALAHSVRFQLEKDISIVSTLSKQVDAYTALMRSEVEKYNIANSYVSALNTQANAALVKLTVLKEAINIETIGEQIKVLGKQVELYDAQISAYNLDGKLKGGKFFTDAWATNIAIDESAYATGIDNFRQPNIDNVLDSLRVSLGFPAAVLTPPVP